MKGFRPGGRRKSGAERAEIGGNLPRGHPCHAFQRPKKPGKTGRYAEEIECEIGKLSDRENRRSSPAPSSLAGRTAPLDSIFTQVAIIIKVAYSVTIVRSFGGINRTVIFLNGGSSDAGDIRFVGVVTEDVRRIEENLNG